MEITDVVLVIDNWKGMEVNFVMTLDDYMAHLDMYELLSEPDFLKDMIKLGKTAAEESVWVENYVSANKTVMAKFCKDRGQLEHFMEGFYNDSNNEWRFDKDESSKECEPFLASIAMNMDGSSKELDMHYEQLDKKNYPGEIVHNFNGHDYRILEQIKDKNFIVFDLNSGSFAVAIGLKNYNRYPKDENPTHENSMEAVSWEHGVYLPQYPSLIDFKLLKEKYGEEVKEEISEEKSFDIEIKEILSRVETVEAGCLDDAIEKAMEMYYSEKIVLDSEDFKGVDFTRYTDETKKR